MGIFMIMKIGLCMVSGQRGALGVGGFCDIQNCTLNESCYLLMVHRRVHELDNSKAKGRVVTLSLSTFYINHTLFCSHVILSPLCKGHKRALILRCNRSSVPSTKHIIQYESARTFK